MLINQTEVRAQIAIELGLPRIHHEKFFSYVRAGAFPKHSTGSKGGRSGMLWADSIIKECIPYIMNYEFDKLDRVRQQREAKTKRAQDNMICKEPVGYTNAFNLMNNCLLN